MTTTQNTPGYNSHLAIYFATDRNGRRVAYRWSGSQMRAFRMALATAELFVAAGQATEIPGNPMRPAVTR